MCPARGSRSYLLAHDVLGFDVIAYGPDFGLPGAAFLAAGGYHHHIDLNTWTSESGTPPPDGHTGLHHFAIVYPDRRELGRAVRRLLDHGHPIDGAEDHGATVSVYLRDPDEQRHRTLLRPAARGVVRRERQPRPQGRSVRPARATGRAERRFRVLLSRRERRQFTETRSVTAPARVAGVQPPGDGGRRLGDAMAAFLNRQTGPSAEPSLWPRRDG